MSRMYTKPAVEWSIYYINDTVDDCINHGAHLKYSVCGNYEAACITLLKHQSLSFLVVVFYNCLRSNTNISHTSPVYISDIISQYLEYLLLSLPSCVYGTFVPVYFKVRYTIVCVW